MQDIVLSFRPTRSSSFTYIRIVVPNLCDCLGRLQQGLYVGTLKLAISTCIFESVFSCVNACRPEFRSSPSLDQL